MYVNPVYLYKPEKNVSEEFVPRLMINSNDEIEECLFNL